MGMPANGPPLDWRRRGRRGHGLVVLTRVGRQLSGWVAPVTTQPVPLRAAADQTDALLHYIPLLRKALAMPEDDPQKHEDDHIKEVKKKSGAK
jgi:hypothetical protein